MFVTYVLEKNTTKQIKDAAQLKANIFDMLDHVLPFFCIIIKLILRFFYEIILDFKM